MLRLDRLAIIGREPCEIVLQGSFRFEVPILFLHTLISRTNLVFIPVQSSELSVGNFKS
jgi:hypothetical protein